MQAIINARCQPHEKVGFVVIDAKIRDYVQALYTWPGFGSGNCSFKKEEVLTD